MARRARFKVPDLPRDRPTVPEANLFARAIYAGPNGGAGCCLHIVLDDGNLGDENIQYCLDHAEHPMCRTLAAMMLRMSKTQRRKVTGH